MHNTYQSQLRYGQFETGRQILIPMVYSESWATSMRVIMCLDVCRVLTWEADAKCQSAHSPLSHLASGSWIWRSGPKTSSIVTFFLRARLSSSPVECIKKKINKHTWIWRIGRPESDSWRKLVRIISLSSASFSSFRDKLKKNFFHVALLWGLQPHTSDCHQCTLLYSFSYLWREHLQALFSTVGRAI